MAAEKRILVVDDDDAIRGLLFTILRRRGFFVDTAKDGAHAMQRLEQCVYVLMLLDLMMPKASGWEVLDALEKREASSRPAVIVLTAGYEHREFNPELVMGTVRKPFDVEMLVDTVAACVNACTAREQAAGCPAPESHHKTGVTDRPKPI